MGRQADVQMQKHSFLDIGTHTFTQHWEQETGSLLRFTLASSDMWLDSWTLRDASRSLSTNVTYSQHDIVAPAWRHIHKQHALEPVLVRVEYSLLVNGATRIEGDNDLELAPYDVVEETTTEN